MSKVKRGALPGIDLQKGHSVSTIIVALTGMINGNYGDMRTGSGDGDYVHVTRLPDGAYRAVHVARRRSLQTDNILRLAQFIWNQVDP